MFESLRPVGLLAKTIDRSFLILSLKRTGQPPEPIAKDVRAALDEISSFYQSAGEALFPTPAPISPVQQMVRRLERGVVIDLSWESAYQPAFAEIKERYQAYGNNRTARARFFRHDAPSPAILCIHGYGGGDYSIEEIAFPVKWLYSLGFDVLLPQLPFHGHRSVEGGWPIFPNAGRTALTNEGFAQAAFDLRALIGFLLQRGAPSVSVTGMSLGGYTTSLLATVEERLSLAAPMIPFASFANLVWEHGRGTTAQKRAIQNGVDEATLAEAFAVHNPLRRSPKLQPEKILIGAGEFDRVTPKEHAYQLKEHFKSPHFVLFPGGHLLQIGRRHFFKALKERARDLQLIG
jgi:pimeloyl-ACP methyl ester carboxylesterase